jgi:outer membrane protein TolC
MHSHELIADSAETAVGRHGGVDSFGLRVEAAPDREALQQENLPNLKLPAAWVETSSAGPVQDNWIATLGDPQLPALVTEAITYNADLRLAVARVEEAAANVKAAGAQLYPSVNLLAKTGGKVGGDGSGVGGVIVPASWEIDLWGRVRYGRVAAEDQYASTEADVAAAAQSIAALVAKSWFLAIQARQQRDLAAEMVASSRELLRIAQQRQTIGPGSAVEVAQASASLQELLDTVRQLDLALAQSSRSLELLLGRYPAPRSRRHPCSLCCRRRRRPVSRRSCSSAGRTSSPPSAASMRLSTWLARPKRRACRNCRLRPH